jgi:hypothetical protein
MRTPRHSIVASLLFLACASPIGLAQDASAPRLVIQITIDGLRGDLPQRYRDRFGPSGFRYLMDQGVYYANAHYSYSATYTGVGHATLFTGGLPAQHGIVANDWFDRTERRGVYCAEDADSPILDAPEGSSSGRSPRLLLSSTSGDEMVLASGGKSRVFGVSLKDRAAILPAGHAGKAFWYDRRGGTFVTSRYYYEAYPDWARAWNDGKRADRYRDQQWTLLRDEEEYARPDDLPGEHGFLRLGDKFPHPLNEHEGDAFYTALMGTPFADALTLDFVRTLIEAESLGEDAFTDMLAVSLSVTDVIHHTYGPDSREAEDNILRLDEELAKLLSFVNQRIGLDRVLIVLCSDHGFGDVPEQSAALHMPSGSLAPGKLMEAANAALIEKLGVSKPLVAEFRTPSFYFDHAAIAEAGVDAAQVERIVAEALLAQPGVALALTRSQLLEERLPHNPTTARVARSFHPGRSGDVIIAQEQGWYLYNGNRGDAAMHGSPYAYDTFVPLMFAGAKLTPRRVYRPVAVEDIAPTVTAFLGVKPPTGSIGRPLVEVLERTARTAPR